MRSFGISLFTALACAIYSAAAPVELAARTGILVSVHVGAHVDLHTIPDVLGAVKTDLICAKEEIEAIVDVDVEVIIGKVKPILEKTKGVLCDALDAVKIIIKGTEGITLTIGGKVLALIDVAHLICDVISLVACILWKAVTLVGTVKVSVIEPLVVVIGSLLATILYDVFFVVDGLLIAVTPLLGDVIQTLVDLNCAQVLLVLGIKL